jgi:general transcription factor 3C polypeptide 5 (transcription factor C subunit 1)
MPDFVYSTVNSSFTNKFRETILPYDCKLSLSHPDEYKANGAQWQSSSSLISTWARALSKIQISSLHLHLATEMYHSHTSKHWPQNKIRHATNTDPPSYRQNPTVKHAVGQSGDITTINTQQPSKIRTFLVRYDIPIVPSKPQESLTPIAKLDPSLRKTVEAIKLLFEERPAWTRRALRNRLATDEHRTNLRWAVPYVGYIFRSGPWRDAIMKLGVDPRTSPEFRHYQTFMFRLLPREPDTARDGGRRHNISRTDLDEDPNSHIFTGKLPLPLDGKIWMVRDIEDPLIKSVLYKEDEAATDGVPFLRETCDIISDGWFGNGALGKAKTIMRAKISSLIEGRMPEEDEFERILEFPDHAETEADLVNFTFDSATSTKRDDMLATEVRAAIKGAPVWRERLEKEKMDGRKKKGKGKEVEVQRDEDQSEGEEEEMERVEMLEEEVAAAIAARDEAEGEDDEVEEEDEAI